MHVTYRYGCPAWAELPAELVEELRLAHDLREELVDWEIAYDREREAILRDASAQYRVAAEALDALLAPEQRDWAAVAGARKEAAPLRKAASGQAGAVLKSLAGRRSRKGRYHALRPGFCDADGAQLHWANWAIVEKAHEQARQAIVSRRASAQPAELHHHRLGRLRQSRRAPVGTTGRPRSSRAAAPAAGGLPSPG